MTPAGVSTDAFFRVLVESVRDYAIFALDAEGRVLSWNEGAQHMTGYTEAEIFGQPYATFFPPEAAAAGRPRELLETAAREGRVEDEGWRIRKDGTRYRADAILTALRDARGELVGYAKVARDLTQRSKADEQARKLLRARVARQTAERSARRMELLARASSVLASSFDYDQTLAAVAELTVPALADFCAVDVVEEKRVRRVAVRHRDASRARVARALGPVDLEGEETWRDGHALLLTEVPDPPAGGGKDAFAMLRVLGLHATVVVPLMAHGQIYGALTLAQSSAKRGFAPEDVALAEDLARRAAGALENARLVHDLENVRGQLQEKATELEEQTADLRRLTTELANKVNEAEAARAVAEEANRAKSRFLATMSHELRTPLNAIAGHADLLALGIHGALNGAQEQALTRIQHNEQRLLALINDIISFAKLEAGQMSCQRKAVPVRDLLVDVRELIAETARRKGVQLRVLQDAGDLSLLADPDRAARVLFNLVDNAVKFTDSGGSVEVGAREYEDRVDLFVRDTGRGIASPRLESIFEPFVQVDQENTRDKEGLGLGLALSRELARSMSGEVDVQSELGRGSTFTLTLPLAPTDDADA